MATAPRSSFQGTSQLARATLERFRLGDAQAFAEVVRRYSPLVHAAVARYWKGAFDREEAMQEIWMHVFCHREAFDLSRAESFSGWLAVLARRRCIDLLRHPEDPLVGKDAEEALARQWLNGPPNQERTVGNQDLARAVEAFAKRLKPRWHEFFVLHFVDGLDYDEIAKRLSISKLRCKYMRSVLAARARRNREIAAALGRQPDGRGADAS
jgi:RNA polymerase sigma-70 factor (ECF subfamily)